MLPKILKTERNKKGLSQMAFAKILGISQQTVGSWEIGRTSPDLDMLVKIAGFFNISTDYLLGNDTLNNKIDTQPEQVLSKDEWDLIHKYRQLSAKAKKKIKANVDIELDDYTESENESRNA